MSTEDKKSVTTSTPQSAPLMRFIAWYYLAANFGSVVLMEGMRYIYIHRPVQAPRLGFIYKALPFYILYASAIFLILVLIIVSVSRQAKRSLWWWSCVGVGILNVAVVVDYCNWWLCARG